MLIQTITKKTTPSKKVLYKRNEQEKGKQNFLHRKLETQKNQWKISGKKLLFDNILHVYKKKILFLYYNSGKICFKGNYIYMLSF